MIQIKQQMDQTQLAKRISSLPKEIQILIDEYNVEHRPRLYNVLKIFKTDKPYRCRCVSCDVVKIGCVLYSHDVREFICSKNCLEDFF
jgi:hypothetical protein